MTRKSERVNWWLTVAANVGVIVGLIFVGLEIRNSSDAVIAQTADSIADGFNTLNLMSIEDPGMSRILRIGITDPDRLTDLEAYRFALLIRSFFNQYWRVHRLYQIGLLPENQWADYATEIAGFIDSPGVQIYISGNPLPEDFLSDVNRARRTDNVTDYMLGRQELDID